MALSAQPVPADAARTFKPAGTPGQANVIAGAAATVVSSVHYQAKPAMNCSGGTCSGVFPPPGPKHQLNVTRMACKIVAGGTEMLAFGELYLVNSNNTSLLAEALPTIYSVNGYNTVNQAVDMQVASSQHVLVNLVLNGGTAIGGECTATGTLDTLQ
jgi:hypothetical protein